MTYGVSPLCDIMEFPKLHHSIHSLHPAPLDDRFHGDVERQILF